MAGVGGKPDMLVCVDFGMTCTGVAYVNFSTGSDRVNTIYEWPGRRHNAADKVPSILVYDKFAPQMPVAWGFSAEGAHAKGPNHVTRDWFKILLDPVQLQKEQQSDPVDAPSSMAQVEKWYEDYLRALYAHIEDNLSSKLSRKTWREAAVQFIFSLPTTWTDKAVVERFREIIQRAGFMRSDAPQHTVEIGLTEAEAAAVHVFREDTNLFRQGEILLIVDAGGGTTDLSVLQIDAIDGGRLTLKQLLVVTGQNIGSVLINIAFRDIVEKRLRQAVDTRTIALSEAGILDIADAAMRSSHFEALKCSFGSSDTEPLSFFDVEVPSLPPNYSNHLCRISNQVMRFDKREFQYLFDTQIAEMCRLIDSQLTQLQQANSNYQINHLILSGGLGKSAYVMSRLKAQYESGGPARMASTANLRVRVTPQPQLSVCMGVVEDRVQRLSAGASILGWRCCRESYGVIFKEKFSEKNVEHRARQTQIDPVDGKSYVVDGIDWFVTVNKAVSSDHPIEHPFFRTVPFPNGDLIFNSRVFVCRSPEARFLPKYKTAEVYQICNVTSDLRSVPKQNFEQKHKSCWSRLLGRQRHYVVRYQIKAIVGAADLRFELWHNGTKMNADNAISVTWEATNAPPTSMQSQANDLETRTSPKFY